MKGKGKSKRKRKRGKVKERFLEKWNNKEKNYC
jgi:hypothetical protein